MVVIGLPELIRQSDGGARQSGSVAAPKKEATQDTLTASPIEAITLQASVVGNGQVQLSSAELRSAAFQSIASGQIALQPVLTNSTLQIPVKIALSRFLASQIGLVGRRDAEQHGLCGNAGLSQR